MRGFTLLEVLIAVGVLCVGTLGVAQLIGGSVRAVALSRAETTAASLASVRLEQLRALTFGYGDTGARITDLATNLSVDPPTSGGGGLTPSPADTIALSTAGFVDYTDEQGRWVGNGAAPPREAVYVRRWAIDPVESGGGDLLVIQVVVWPLASAPASSAAVRVRGAARFATVLARAQR